MRYFHSGKFDWPEARVIKRPPQYCLISLPPHRAPISQTAGVTSSIVATRRYPSDSRIVANDCSCTSVMGGFAVRWSRFLPLSVPTLAIAPPVTGAAGRHGSTMLRRDDGRLQRPGSTHRSGRPCAARVRGAARLRRPVSAVAFRYIGVPPDTTDAVQHPAPTTLDPGHLHYGLGLRRSRPARIGTGPSVASCSRARADSDEALARTQEAALQRVSGPLTHPAVNAETSSI